jgi:multidrug resistance protein, MATE family
METKTWRSHYWATLLLAAPVCLSNMGHIFVDLADNYFIGQLTEKTVGQAAVSLAGSFYIFILVLMIGVSYSITPLIAEANAQNKKEEIAGHLRHSLLVNFLFSIFLVIVLMLAAPLLHKTDKPNEVVELSIRFLNVIMFSMIPLSIFFTCKQFTEGLSDTKAAMYVTVGANLLNILLNYLLVFGHWGFPRMGVMGSCWATFIARCAMAIAMVIYIWYNKNYKQYRTSFRFGNYDRAVFREQLKIGIPSGLMFSMEVAAFSMPTLFIPEVNQLAAHRISLSLASMTYMVSSGLGAAATIRVGHYLGLNDRLGYRRAGFSAVFLSICFMLIGAICFIVFRRELPAIFNTDENVLSVAAPLLLIAAAFQLFDGMQVTLQGSLRGMQDAIAPGYIAFVAYWIVGLPSSYILCIPFGLGAIGVWYGFVFGLLVASMGFLWRFHRLTKM